MSDFPRTPSKVSLEDLLRLKRAERPPADFWPEFDRRMRAKQLAALVEKRPWWKSWSYLKWSVPVGATAAVAVTFVALQNRPAPTPFDQPTSTVVAAVEPAVRTETVPSSTAQDNVAEIAPAREAAVLVAHAEPADPVPAAPEAPAPSRSAASLEGQLASVTEQIAGIGVDPAPEGLAVARFATSRESTSFASLTPGLDRSVLARADAAFRTERTATVEPLAQIPTPRDARRARLLAFTSSVDTRSPQYSNSSGVIRSRERIANHLNEEALYDSIRRLGVKGNGVSIQF